MQILRCLYLEDDATDQYRYSKLIEGEWKKVQPGLPIDIVHASTFEEVTLKLESREFDLFIADIFLQGERQSQMPIGLQAISLARSTYPNIAILALSMGNGGLEQKCKNEGADDYVSKVLLTDNADAVKLGAKILTSLRMHGKTPHMTPVATLELPSIASNLPLISLCDEIGRETIVSLVDQITRKKSKKLVPHFVRPGLSGAAVICVDYQIDTLPEEPPSSGKLLVKLSKTRESLESEINGNKAHFPNRLFVDFTSSLVQSGPWFAISSEFQENALTLRDWVIFEKKKSNVDNVFDLLFLGDGLGTVYSKLARNTGVRANRAILDDCLTLSRRSRVQKTVSDFQGLAQKYDQKRSWFDRDLIRRLIGDERRIGDLGEEEFPIGVSRCWSHGDLHGNNILVKKGVRHSIPILIDPANIRPMHWGLDIARLTVDLAIAGMDSGDASHEWEFIDDWLAAIDCVIRGEQIPVAQATERNVGVYHSLNWITKNLRKVAVGTDESWTPRWEFVLCFACELLRCSYREQELPSPKRALALIASCEAIREVEREFRKAPRIQERN